MAARRKKRPLRPRVPSRVKKRTRRSRSQHENELLGLALLALGPRARSHPLPRSRRRRGRLVARRRADGDHRQRRLRAARRARRARRAPARPQRPPGGATVPARRGSELPRPDDAPRQGLGRLHRARDRRHARRAHRADRCGDHRRRTLAGGSPARDGRFDGSDPASHGSRDEAGGNGSSPRVRVAVERVADRRGRPHPRARARPAPAAPATGRSGVLPGRRRRKRTLGRDAAPRRRRPRAGRSRASSPRSRRRPSTPSTGFPIARCSARRLREPRRRATRARRPPTCSSARCPSSAWRRA